MKKTIKTTKVNESTKTCKALYCTLYSVTNLYIVKECISFCINFFFKIFSAVYNNICFII